MTLSLSVSTRLFTMAAVEVSALPSSSLPVESKALDVLPLQDVARCEYEEWLLAASQY